MKRLNKAEVIAKKEQKTALKFMMGSILFLAALFSALAGSFAAENTNVNTASDGIKTNIGLTVAAPEQIHDVIKDHLIAIENRDADQAYALTTSKLHGAFENPDDYLEDLRYNARALYHNEAYKFIGSYNVPGGIIQTIEITDRYKDEGTTVMFKVIKTDKGSWLIDSFTVLEQDAQPI